MDGSTGDFICTNCGLVLQGQCLDEGKEWRTFASEGIEMGQKFGARERGDACEDGSTTMSGADAKSLGLQKAQRRAEYSALGAAGEADRQLKSYEGRLRGVGSCLGITEAILVKAYGLLKALSDKGEFKSGQRASFLCAVLYLACLEERSARTYKEFAHAVAPMANVKPGQLEAQMRKRVVELTKTLSSELDSNQAGYIQPEELMARFVNKLGLSNDICKPAIHVCSEAYRLNMTWTHSQEAVTIGAVMVVAWLLNVPNKPHLEDAVKAIKLDFRVVGKAYGEIRRHIKGLLPKNFVIRLPGGVEALPR